MDKHFWQKKQTHVDTTRYCRSSSSSF